MDKVKIVKKARKSRSRRRRSAYVAHVLIEALFAKSFWAKGDQIFRISQPHQTRVSLHPPPPGSGDDHWKLSVEGVSPESVRWTLRGLTERYQRVIALAANVAKILNESP